MESTNHTLRPSDEAIAKYFTPEALSFVPTEQDIFITISKGHQRLIFSPPMVLDEIEEKYLREFREHYKAKGLEIPPGYDDDTRLVLRFLQGSGFSYEKAEAAI